MKRDTAITITTSLILSAVLAWGMHSNHTSRVAAIAAKEAGNQWMQDTTERLEGIDAKLERITNDIISVAMEVDELAERVRNAGI